MKKALIFDLDNTIYPVPSIGAKLFEPVFKKIEESGAHNDDLEEIKKDMMRIPFQKVAEEYDFDEKLQEDCIKLLQELTYDEPMQAFEDFERMRSLPVDRFLVTTGFMKMQQSKVKALELEKDFKEIFIIDPMVNDKQKKDIFQEIVDKYKYNKSEVLVIGDDLDSEIKGATELGIDTVYYDKNKQQPGAEATYIISNFDELKLDED
ncbi:HAD family hydrolase [Aridibaculum aurantiacum]|uniref:HAD family hydrolase n=1 Tax=Aridibaculum aurantiacum TaxID=2810307 RepID=UPI001A9611D3|nr:HAD family hydrolase [Aridibaculum aurantiacum]